MVESWYTVCDLTRILRDFRRTSQSRQRSLNLYLSGSSFIIVIIDGQNNYKIVLFPQHEWAYTS